MTIQNMSTLARPLPSRRPLFLIAAVLLLGAGAAAGWAVTSRATFGDQRVEAVQREAASTSDAVGGLQRRLEALQKDVHSLKAGNDRVATRLSKATEALWAALTKVRGLVADARAGSNEALSGAESALQRAESAARNLSVLEKRFDYHMRVDHGGG